MKVDLRSPYPWFGGKSKVAIIVWDAFGDTRNYVEPFFGSGAMLLGRPHWPFRETRTETVNDMDGFVTNFWRALQRDPDAVALHADKPVDECELTAQHTWLVKCGRPDVERLKTDRDYCNPEIAGVWVWGLCNWIGGGWCDPIRDGGRIVRKRPHLVGVGKGVQRGTSRDGLSEYLRGLADRMRHVRVCCGDWSRVCGPCVTTTHGVTGVMLDPPYSAEAGRDEKIYTEESLTVAHDVRAWCEEVGDDPLLRIALCGYEGDGHESLERLGWRVVSWKAKGGYANLGDNRGKDNAKRERIWFSPHCLLERGLFD